MRSLIVISLLALTLGNILREEHEILQEIAPFDILDIEENPFKDYTDEQLKGLLNAEVPSMPQEEDEEEDADYYGDIEDEDYEAVDNYDFRTKYPKCDNVIIDQGSMFPSSAITVSKSLTQRFCQATASSFNQRLSAQFLSICNPKQSTVDYWAFTEKVGVVTDVCIPMSYQGDTCPTECKNKQTPFTLYKSKNVKNFTTPKAIKDEILLHGPIHTTFKVYSDFMQYSRGIYQRRSDYLLGGHVVVIIGWGVEGGINYWIAANSWGTTWGERGYFRIAFNECDFDKNGRAGVPVVN